MTDELKPCPFCGGEAELEQVCEDWHINCENFKCPATSFVIKSSVQKAIEAWNTRYERTCQPVKDDKGYIRCSICGNELYTDYDPVADRVTWEPFCPSCGAKVVDDDQL